MGEPKPVLNVQDAVVVDQHDAAQGDKGVGFTVKAIRRLTSVPPLDESSERRRERCRWHALACALRLEDVPPVELVEYCRRVQRGAVAPAAVAALVAPEAAVAPVVEPLPAKAKKGNKKENVPHVAAPAAPKKVPANADVDKKKGDGKKKPKKVTDAKDIPVSLPVPKTVTFSSDERPASRTPEVVEQETSQVKSAKLSAPAAVILRDAPDAFPKIRDPQDVMCFSLATIMEVVRGLMSFLKTQESVPVASADSRLVKWCASEGIPHHTVEHAVNPHGFQAVVRELLVHQALEHCLTRYYAHLKVLQDSGAQFFRYADVGYFLDLYAGSGRLSRKWAKLLDQALLGVPSELRYCFLRHVPLCVSFSPHVVAADYSREAPWTRTCSTVISSFNDLPDHGFVCHGVVLVDVYYAHDAVLDLGYFRHLADVVSSAERLDVFWIRMHFSEMFNLGDVHAGIWKVDSRGSEVSDSMVTFFPDEKVMQSYPPHPTYACYDVDGMSMLQGARVSWTNGTPRMSKVLTKIVVELSGELPLGRLIPPVRRPAMCGLQTNLVPHTWAAPLLNFFVARLERFMKGDTVFARRQAAYGRICSVFPQAFRHGLVYWPIVVEMSKSNFKMVTKTVDSSLRRSVSEAFDRNAAYKATAQVFPEVVDVVTDTTAYVILMCEENGEHGRQVQNRDRVPNNGWGSFNIEKALSMCVLAGLVLYQANKTGLLTKLLLRLHSVLAGQKPFSVFANSSVRDFIDKTRSQYGEATTKMLFSFWRVAAVCGVSPLIETVLNRFPGVGFALALFESWTWRRTFGPEHPVSHLCFTLGRFGAHSLFSQLPFYESWAVHTALNVTSHVAALGQIIHPLLGVGLSMGSVAASVVGAVRMPRSHWLGAFATSMVSANLPFGRDWFGWTLSEPVPELPPAPHRVCVELGVDVHKAMYGTTEFLGDDYPLSSLRTVSDGTAMVAVPAFSVSGISFDVQAWRSSEHLFKFTSKKRSWLRDVKRAFDTPNREKHMYMFMGFPGGYMGAMVGGASFVVAAIQCRLLKKPILDPCEQRRIWEETRGVPLSELVRLDTSWFVDMVGQTPQDAYVQSMTNQKKVKSGAILEWEESGFRRECSASLFAKTDEVLRVRVCPDAPDRFWVKPRVIKSMNPEWVGATGCALWLFTKDVAETFKIRIGETHGPVVPAGVFQLSLSYGSCALHTDLAKWWANVETCALGQAHLIVAGDDSLLVLRTENGTFILEGDFSMFDQSQSYGPLDEEIDDAVRWGADDAAVSHMHSVAYVPARFDCGPPSRVGVRLGFDDRPIRATGGLNTTAGNSLTTMRAFLRFVRTVGLEETITAERVEHFFLGLGFEIKAKVFSHSERFSVTFLKGMWVPHRDRLSVHWVPLMSRVLKLCKSLAPPHTYFDLRGVPRAERPWLGFCLFQDALKRSWGDVVYPPLVRAYFARVPELPAGYREKFPVIGSLDPFWVNLSSSTTVPRVDTADLDFTHMLLRYGLDAQDVEIAEKEMLRIPFGVFGEVPGLGSALLNADY
jgi:hypothetical protein